MAEPKKGTAVAPPKASMLERLLSIAKTPEERLKAYEIAEGYQRTQLVQELVAEVKASSWGNRVSPMLRAGIVRWALEVGADPVDEVDILGGGPYLNARYWMRLCAAEPDFVRPEEVWVHEDPRASDEENAKRLALRVQYAIPDAIDGNLGLKQSERKKNPEPVPVKAAVLVFGHFKERGPFLGKKWSPSRANDDVGLDFPEPAALTRAWRKMALQAVRQQPRVTDKLKALVAAQERASEVTEALRPLNLKPVATDGGYPTEPVEPLPAKVGVIEKHQPNAICQREGEHPREECGHWLATQKREDTQS